MTNVKKVISILILSVIFGIGQSIIDYGSDIGQMIVSTFIPIIFTLIISGLYIGVLKIITKELKGITFIGTTWKIFIPLIILFYLSLMVSLYNKPKTNIQSSNDDVYKKTVQNNNANAKKEVGDVKTEFLNKDNLYENYTYNYSIKLPEDYKVNYGIGKHAEIMAYHKDSGYVVSVNVSDLSKNYVPSNLSPSEEAEKKIKDVYAVLTEPASIKNMEMTFEKRGFIDVHYLKSKLTNYNNRTFIYMKFEANQIIDNEKYPTIILDLVTINVTVHSNERRNNLLLVIATTKQI